MRARELGSYAQRELGLDVGDLRMEPISSRRLMEMADGERARLARLARLEGARMVLAEEAALEISLLD